MRRVTLTLTLAITLIRPLNPRLMLQSDQVRHCFR